MGGCVSATPETGLHRNRGIRRKLTKRSTPASSIDELSSTDPVFAFRYKVVGKVLDLDNDTEVFDGLDAYTGKKVSVKVSRLTSEMSVHRRAELRRRYVDETHILSCVNHRNIINLVDYNEDGDKLIIISEHVEGGDLLDKLASAGCLAESDAKEIILRLVDALEYLHGKNIVHRDIQPESIALRSSDNLREVALTNFSLAANNNSRSLVKKVGNPMFMAPEVIRGQMFGKPADVWALGVVLYILVNGSFPFYSVDFDKLNELITSGKFTPFRPHVSPEARNLITNILCVDPLRRFSLQQIKDHEWMRSQREALAHPSIGTGEIAKSVSHFSFELE